MKCQRCGKEMKFFCRRTRSKVQVHYECEQDGCGFKSKYGYGKYVGEATADAMWKTEESRLSATDIKDGCKEAEKIRQMLKNAQRVEARRYTHVMYPPEKVVGIFVDPVLETKIMRFIDDCESTYSQVSKALCGKENATLDELLQAVDQLKRMIER